MSYKPDTYITEESAGLHLAQHLKRHGYRVLVHDYAAKPSNSPALHEFEVVNQLEGCRTPDWYRPGGCLLSVAAIPLP